ncbi:hypothetical protein Tco_0744683 [Tanacetum coccineum]
MALAISQPIITSQMGSASHPGPSYFSYQSGQQHMLGQNSKQVGQSVTLVGQSGLTPKGHETLLPNAFSTMTLQDPTTGNWNMDTVVTSLIHIESRKSPTVVLFDVDSGRISIRHSEILKNITLNVLARS